jgi:hypothetical protein
MRLPETVTRRYGKKYLVPNTQEKGQIDMYCSLASAVGLLAQAYGSDYSGIAKCNCVVNLVSLLEVHHRRRVLKDCECDMLLEGDFTANLISMSSDEHERGHLALLLDIRNCFVHEGLITVVSDEEIAKFILLTKSILDNEPLG